MKHTSARSRSDREPLPAGFGVLWTTVALDLVGFGIVIPLLPVYARDLGASPTQVGLILATYSLAQLVMSPVLGAVSDRRGRRAVLIMSLVGSALGSLVTGLAGSMVVLYLGRLLDGASGASIATAQAVVADIADEKERPRLYGLLGAAFGIGFVAGPALGGLAGVVDRRLPFLLAAAIAGVNAVAAWRRLPETAPPDRTDRRSGSVSERLRERGRVLHQARRWVLVAFVATLAFSGFEATFPLLAEDRLGVGVAGVGLIFACVGVVLALSQSLLVGPVVNRLGPRGALRTGIAAVAVGLATLAAAETWSVVAFGLFALVVGQSLVTPSTTTLVAGAAGSADRGVVLGAQQSAAAAARTIGPVLAGGAWSVIAPGAPYLVGAVALMVVWAWMWPAEPVGVDEPGEPRRATSRGA